MELILGAMVMAWVIMEAPQAINDAYVARKAAKAGEWDFLNGHEARRDARSAARAARRQAWAERIFRRNQADQSGQPRRPGLGTLAGDVYHGMCEDALTKRAARRGARPPYDPTRPTWRQQAWRRLRDKVRAQRQSARDPRPVPDDEQIPGPQATRATCPGCGQTVTRGPSGWQHPGGEPCPRQRTAPEPDDQYPIDGFRWTDDDREWARQNNRNHTDREGDTMSKTAGDGTQVADTATNEALRQAADVIMEGAAEVAEGAAMAERGRAKMAAAAQAASDAVSGTAFDGGATAASHAAADAAGAVSDSTISAWCEKSEAAHAAAEQMKQSLEKYRDAEDLVASNRVDGRTLEPSAS